MALVTEQGYSIAQAAQAVDTKENNLRRWKKALEQEAVGERLNTDERAELARLRRENKALRMEKEILKSASWHTTHAGDRPKVTATAFAVMGYRRRV